MAVDGLPAGHRRRLKDLWRSAGWPCRDGIELDLLAAGLITRHWDSEGRESLRLSDAGLAVLTAQRARARSAMDRHESLVARVAHEQQRAGRIVWRGLSLRVAQQVEGATKWGVARPDVFSIRHTTVEDYAEPAVHEIKVSRADLLSDLRCPRKAGAYLGISSQCWYVLDRGIAEADEIPAEFGVLLADEGRLEVARPAPRRAMRVGFATWMALARATAEDAVDDGQGLLGAGGETVPT